MKHKLAIIKEVLPESIASEAGLEKGDALISINSCPVDDIFDYRFLMTDEELLLETQKPDGEIWHIDIEKDEYEDLGIEFESAMIDEAKSCSNKCIFCFIDQLPTGMRDTLYFKDDDSRLSFLTGNYVTLTNISRKDLDRVVRYRMSPINISVHTTNPELRVFMLKNKKSGDVIDKIKLLVENGITVNCQIVLCRGINDGVELDRTISDLTGLYPDMCSISVVPVGITKHREKLFPLKPFDETSSQAVIGQVQQWQEKLLNKHGSRIVYLADEFYIMAGYTMPVYEYYEDFPQIENGVGLISQLMYEFKEHLENLKVHKELKIPEGRTVSIATGASPYKYIKQLAEILENKYNIKINVYTIKNGFFGENVTVTGLLTGSDIINQLEGQVLGDELLICRCMLKAGTTVFLDDHTLDTVSGQLGSKVTVVENEGKDLIEKILGISTTIE